MASICGQLGVAEKALVTRHIHSDIEAMIGAVRHPEIGPAVLLGTGGIFAEAVKDRVWIFPPFTEEDVSAAVRHLALGRVISSPRTDADVGSLAELAVAVGDLAAAAEWLVELDLNPVLLSSAGARIADVRVVAR
jgi:hypothetical protein